MSDVLETSCCKKDTIKQVDVNQFNPYATLGDKSRQHWFTTAGDLLVWGLVSDAS